MFKGKPFYDGGMGEVCSLTMLQVYVIRYYYFAKLCKHASIFPESVHSRHHGLRSIICHTLEHIKENDILQVQYHFLLRRGSSGKDKNEESGHDLDKPDNESNSKRKTLNRKADQP